MFDANNFIGVRAVFVAVSAITSVDIAVVAEIIAGVVTNARDVVSVQNTIIGRILFIVDGTYSERGRVSVGYEVM